MLTRKQYELLMYIHECLQRNGIPPSFDEMKDALDLRSKSGIHRLITGLEERGFIRRLPHRARALEILRLPDNMAAERSEKRGFAPTVIRNESTPLAGARPTGLGEVVQLPLYGRIAAGTPIEALRDEANQVDVTTSLLEGGEHYALEVAGESMIDAGIFDGDTVIVQRCDSAENGAIVVALIDDVEVTDRKSTRLNSSH